MDIVAQKTLKRRGQAFIVFKDLASATAALRQMQSFPFYDKPMKIAYAKDKSDVISKLDGTFGDRDKRRVEKRKAEAQARKSRTKKRTVSSGGSASASGDRHHHHHHPPIGQSSQHLHHSIGMVGAGRHHSQVPNNILFVENLPEQCNELMLSMLFQQFPGFKEVRLVPNKKGIAFVEFTNELEAGVAMNGLQGFKITPENHMTISFAKK